MDKVTTSEFRLGGGHYMSLNDGADKMFTVANIQIKL